MGSFFRDGHFEYVCNERFQNTFMSADDFATKARALKLIQTFPMCRWGESNWSSSGNNTDAFSVVVVWLAI